MRSVAEAVRRGSADVGRVDVIVAGVGPQPADGTLAIVERDGNTVSSSYPRCAPFVMARGAGAVVEDVDGNVYLDCCAGIAVALGGVL